MLDFLRKWPRTERSSSRSPGFARCLFWCARNSQALRIDSLTAQAHRKLSKVRKVSIWSRRVMANLAHLTNLLAQLTNLAKFLRTLRSACAANEVLARNSQVLRTAYEISSESGVWRGQKVSQTLRKILSDSQILSNFPIRRISRESFASEKGLLLKLVWNLSHCREAREQLNAHKLLDSD